MIFPFILSSNNELLILDNVTYPNASGYQDDLIIAEQGLAGYQWAPIIWTILDKTFISIFNTDSPNKKYIYVYDHFRNKVSNAIYTGLESEGASNIHHAASIISINSKLFLTETSFHGSSGNWKFALSGTNYDINNFEAWTDTV